MMRFSLLLCVFTMVSQVASAQLYGLPSEAELNRLGLTLAWRGQAVIDPNRDRIKYLTADEQNVYLQATSGIVTTFAGETGRRLWSSLVGQPDQAGHPASTNGEQLLLSVGLKVYSLDKMTGEILWEMRIPDHPATSPEIDDEQIFVGTVDGSVFSYDLRKIQGLYERRMLPQWTERARMWRFKTPDEIVSQPIVAGETLSYASQRGIVYGVSKQDKKLRFQFESEGKIFTSLGRSKDLIFIPDTKARLYCINQNNGRVQWSFSSGAPIREQPFAVGFQVYAIPQREGIAALSIASGRQLWQQPRATQFVAASETRVYASDASGNLLVLDRQDGTIIGILPMRDFDMRVSNDRTDRIYLSNSRGMVIGLRELDSEFPLYHLYPQRRPILPLFADEEPAEADDAAGADDANM